MPKGTTRQLKEPKPKRLIDGPNDWAETKTLIREHVERICMRYDDREQSESLCLLIDLLCNEDYDRLDREAIMLIAKDHAFTFTDAFHTAQHITLGKMPQGTELRMVA